jgi:serine/threonine protein kinase/Flp pilus assembly protein TadD
MAEKPIDEKEIFNSARQIAAPEERLAYVETACAGDPAAVQRILELLRIYDQERSFLESSPVAQSATIDEPISERPGTTIGPYKLLEEIGEGGFGVVFLAEQTEPVRRRVALKVLKPGMDTRQVVARFEAERQALAIMDHAHIAKVYDAGATPSGRPYFVMELVKGVPITDFCDQNHLTPRQRLELFIPVCQAIQHAHQKGIIHRDLKPTNVLVSRHDTTPVPKVIDFGVAKALGQELTEKTLFTSVAQMVGTPLYMSPEQAGMSDLDVDTRSDIYSLGVLLYELLTGTTPFSQQRFRQASYDEIRRIIREEEPPRPSTRLSDSRVPLPSISAQRHTEPAKLTRLVRGELDWIVMKALEKDRNRRYETASAFAADVHRYLDDEPVQACPPSAGYRLRKFVRRKKRVLATALVLSVALLVAIGGVAWSVGWANRDREARQAAVEQEANLALKEAERWEEQRRWPEALSAAKRAEGLLAGGGSDDLRDRARELRRDVEMVLRLEDARHQGLGGHDNENDFNYAAMDAAYRKAFRDYGINVEAMPVERASELIRARPIRLELTSALDAWAVLPAAAPLADKLLAIARAADPDEVRNHVRDALRSGEPNKARLAELAASPQVRAQPPSTLCALGNALVFADLGGDAVALLRDAQQHHPDDFWINFYLAWAIEPESREPLDEHVRFFSAALALRPGSSMAAYYLGRALFRKERPEEAVVYFRRAAQLDPGWFKAHSVLGGTLAMTGRLDEAIAEFRKAIALEPTIPMAHYNLGLVLWIKGQRVEAVASVRKGLGLRGDKAEPHVLLGNALAEFGRWNDAAAAFDAALAADPTSHDSWCTAAALRAAVGNREGYRRTCRQILERFGDTDQPQMAERIARACLLLSDVFDAADFDRVQKLAARAVTGTEKDPAYRSLVLTRGLADYRAGRHADAVKWLQRFPPDPDGTHQDAAKFAVVAMAQHGLGRAEEAQVSLAKAKAILTKMPDPAKGQPFGAGDWHDWLRAQVFCREAEGLLKKEPAVNHKASGNEPN